MDGPPDGVQLGAYFDLIEVSALLRHRVEQQLREDGDLSSVQFQLLARLGDAPDGSARMTELADGIVYSRSGLTYQAGLLERAGLLVRSPAAGDDRGVIATITAAGRSRLEQVLPNHVRVVDALLYSALDRPDLEALAGLLAELRDHMRAAPPRSASRRVRTGD